MILYRDIADMINKRKFKLIVNETYQPVIHPIFLEENAPLPVNMPGDMDENNKCITMVPVANIIDMIQTGTEFAIYDRRDLFEITELLRLYVETYREPVAIANDPEQNNFMRGAIETLNIMQQRVERYHKQHYTPTVRQNIVDIINTLLGGTE